MNAKSQFIFDSSMIIQYAIQSLVQALRVERDLVNVIRIQAKHYLLLRACHHAYLPGK